MGLLLCNWSYCVLALGLPFLLATSGIRYDTQHGIEKESRSWRLDGGRPFPLEHGLFFEPTLPEPRPGTISCEAWPSVIPRGQNRPKGISSGHQPSWTHISRLTVACPTCLAVSFSLALLLCSSQALKHCPPVLLLTFLILSALPLPPTHSPFFLLSSTRDGGKNLGEGKACEPKSEPSSSQSSPFPRLATQQPGKRTKPQGNKGCLPTCQHPTAAAPGCSGNELRLLLQN